MWILAFPAKASHIVGGELDLQHQQGSTYQLTLNLYFDDVNGDPTALDRTMIVSLFAKGTNQRMTDFDIGLVDNSFVAYTNPACESPSLRTRHLVYRAPLELDTSLYTNPLGYYVVVERCCRNRTISNISKPEDAGQTFYLEFPPVVKDGQPLLNSTPKIFPPLSDYACRGELFYYDFGGADADGDSLVYELAAPLNGHSSPFSLAPLPAPAPYPAVQWLPGLSLQNQIPGSPALGIDRRTGRLTVRPSQLGLFVFAIKCSEYRQGVKLGEVRRDFQLKVLNCPPNQTPDLTLRLPNQRQDYVPGQQVFTLAPGADRCVRLRLTDPDPNSQLSLSLHPVNFTGGPLPTFSLTQGVVRTPGRPDTLVSQLCFPTCLDTKGKVYLLDVIVADNGCSLPRRDTVQLAFTASPPPNAAPQLSTTAPQPLTARPGELVTFDVLAIDADQDELTLQLQGMGIDPLALGAQFTITRVGPGQLRGRLSWRVPCPPAGQSRYELAFTTTAAPCGLPQTSRLLVPIVLDLRNTPPVLTVTAEATRPLLVRPGQLVRLPVRGIDADLDAVRLALSGQGFAAAEVGASLSFIGENGLATGTFTWLVPCPPAGSPLNYTFALQASSTACASTQTDQQLVAFRIDPSNQAPVLSLPNSPALPLRAKVGELLTLEVLATDADLDPLSLQLRAGPGLDGAALGATFTLLPGTAGGEQRGRLSWRVPCPPEGQSRYEMVFASTDVPCQGAATTSLRVAVEVEAPNTAPTLSSSLFDAPLLVRQLPGEVFEATVRGTDVDGHALTLTAQAVGTDLASAGMRLDVRPDAGGVTGTFRWQASCQSPRPQPVDVVFTLQEDACRPLPQQRTVRFEVADPEPVAFLPPNVFTPNQDGKNDAFELPQLPPDYCDQRFARIQIFNRWGQPVYASTARTFRWEGTGQPAGVYYYLIQYTNQRQFKGHVTLAQ
ncbi:hypothetical protein GCM10027346_42740 [Hymenobacter seoulensis]